MTKSLCLEGEDKMPANVETMFSAVETPWHRIGTVTDTALNSKDAIKAGANILVSGTTIFKSNNGDIKKNIKLLKSK